MGWQSRPGLKQRKWLYKAEMRRAVARQSGGMLRMLEAEQATSGAENKITVSIRRIFYIDRSIFGLQTTKLLLDSFQENNKKRLV